MNAVVSAGLGAIQMEDEVVTSMRISKNWIRMNTQASNFKHLGLVTAKGDSMSPTFEDGSILLVDTGVRQVDVDAVYVLARDNKLFVKRVRRLLSKGFEIISDNPRYGREQIDSTASVNLQVLGRVLVGWNANKL